MTFEVEGRKLRWVMVGTQPMVVVADVLNALGSTLKAAVAVKKIPEGKKTKVEVLNSGLFWQKDICIESPEVEKQFLEGIKAIENVSSTVVSKDHVSSKPTENVGLTVISKDHVSSKSNKHARAIQDTWVITFWEFVKMVHRSNKPQARLLEAQIENVIQRQLELWSKSYYNRTDDKWIQVRDNKLRLNRHSFVNSIANAINRRQTGFTEWSIPQLTDEINFAVFGMTAKTFRDENPHLWQKEHKNLRDIATSEQNDRVFKLEKFVERCIDRGDCLEDVFVKLRELLEFI